jgi:hypothetical protein
MDRDVKHCPAVDALLENPRCVHLLVHIRGDWDRGREARVREAEERTSLAQSYAQSAPFRARYPGRIGVVRMQTDEAVPSVVASVLTERGIEVEDLSAPRDEGGPACATCGRDRLTPEQAAMTDEGWSCPSCFRAWTVRTQPQLAKPTRRIVIPPWLLWSALIVLGLLFLYAVGNELRYLTHMNRIIRQHMPQ